MPALFQNGLAVAMARRKLTGVALEKLTRIDRRRISELRSGSRLPTWAELLDISYFLDVQLPDLYSDAVLRAIREAAGSGPSFRSPAAEERQPQRPAASSGAARPGADLSAAR